MSRCGFGATVLVLLLFLRVPASAAIIDFEALADGDILTNQIPGLMFTGVTVLSAGISLNEAEFPPSSGVNAAVDLGGSVRIDFSVPVAGFSALFTYFFPLTLQAFDSANVLLAADVSAFNSNAGLSGDAGSNPNELLQVAAPNIAYVTIIGGATPGDSLAFDDVTVVETTAIPEPATLSLLGFGSVFLLAARLAQRRLRRSQMTPAIGWRVPLPETSTQSSVQRLIRSCLAGRGEIWRAGSKNPYCTKAPNARITGACTR